MKACLRVAVLDSLGQHFSGSSTSHVLIDCDSRNASLLLYATENAVYPSRSWKLNEVAAPEIMIVASRIYTIVPVPSNS